MTTPKKPPRAAGAARSTAKRARGPLKRPARRPWPDDVRERALELLRTDGVAAAHAGTGVPKGTLSGWAKAAGVEVPTHVKAEQLKAAAQLSAAERTVTLVERLDGIATKSATLLEHLIDGNLDVAELDDDDLGRWNAELERFVPPEDRTAAAQAMRRQHHLSTLLPARDVVGVLTRAVHDLALLRGEATERGTIEVSFGAMPRPDARASDASAVDQDALGDEPKL
jgi:transposase-like protein